MINFYLIQDTQLRGLAMASRIIAGLSEEEQLQAVEKLSTASPEIITQVKTILTKELQDTEKAQAEELARVQNDIHELDLAMTEVNAMQKQYENSMRQFTENKSIAEDNLAAENLLQTLNTL